jgi:hypothetical protein
LSLTYEYLIAYSTGNKKRKGGDESFPNGSTSPTAATAPTVTFAPLPQSSYSSGTGGTATATANNSGANAYPPGYGSPFSPGGASSSNGTSGSTSPYHPSAGAAAGAIVATGSPFSGSAASPASPASPNGSVSPQLSSPSSPLSPDSGEEADRPHTKARRVGDRPSSLATATGSYVPPALTSATTVDVTNRGALVPPAQQRPMMLSDVVVHVMTREELKHQIVSAIQARPYIGTWMQSPQSVHPPALTLYHPTGMPSWDRTSEVVFFFNSRYCVPALGVSFSPYSTISCFPPHPPNQSIASPPLSSTSLSSRASNNSFASSPGGGPLSPQHGLVNLSSTLPAKPQSPGLTNGVHGHQGQPDALTPATSASEASVFVAWLNSPLFYVGKYLYTRAGDPATSSIMTPVDDGGLRDDLEPLTHMVIKLRIPSRDLPASFAAHPTMAGPMMRAMEAMLQAWVSFRIAACMTSERLVLLKTLMMVSQRLEVAESRHIAESKRKSLITQQLEAVDEKRARGSSLTGSPLLGPRKTAGSITFESMSLDTSARGRASSRVPIDNTSPTSSLVHRFDGPPEEWPLIKPSANHASEDETIWSLLRSALQWRYEELERNAKDSRKAAIQASFDAQSDMKRSGVASATRGGNEEKKISIKKEPMDTSGDDSSTAASPYSPPSSPEIASPRTNPGATASVPPSQTPATSAPAKKNGLPSLSAHVSFAIILRDTELLTRLLSLAPMLSPPSTAAPKCSYEVFSKPTPEFNISPSVVAQLMDVEDTAKAVLESCAAAFEQQQRDRLNDKLRSGEAMAAMASGVVHGGATLSQLVGAQAPSNGGRVGSFSIAQHGDGVTKGTGKTTKSRQYNSNSSNGSTLSDNDDNEAMLNRKRPSLWTRTFITPTFVATAMVSAITVFSALRMHNGVKWEDKSTGLWYPVDVKPYVYVTAIASVVSLVGASLWNALLMRLWVATSGPSPQQQQAAGAAADSARSSRCGNHNWQLSVQRLLFFVPLFCILGLSGLVTDLVWVNASMSIIAKVVAITFLTMAAFDVIWPFQWWRWLRLFQQLTHSSLQSYQSNRTHIGASRIMTALVFLFQTGIMMVCSVFFVPLFCDQPDTMGTMDANLSLVGLFWILELSRNIQHVYNVRLMMRSQYITPYQGSTTSSGLTSPNSSGDLTSAAETLSTQLMSNSRFRVRGTTPHTRCGELRDIFARRFGTIAAASIFTSFEPASIFLRKMGRSLFTIGKGLDWFGKQFIRPPSHHSLPHTIPAELRDIQNSQALQEFSSVSMDAAAATTTGSTSTTGAKATHFLPQSRSSPLYNPEDSAQSRANSRTVSGASGALVAAATASATDSYVSPMISRTVSLVSARTTSTMSAAAPMSSSNSPDHRPLGTGISSGHTTPAGAASTSPQQSSTIPLTASFSPAERSLATIRESKEGDRLTHRDERSSSSGGDDDTNNNGGGQHVATAMADIDVSWRENKRVYTPVSGVVVGAGHLTVNDNKNDRNNNGKRGSGNDWRDRSGAPAQPRATCCARFLPAVVGNIIGGFFRLIGWLVFISLGRIAWAMGEIMQSSTSRHILTVAEWQNVGYAKAASQLSKLRVEADLTQAGEVSWSFSIEEKLVDMGACIVGFACFLGAFEYLPINQGLGVGGSIYAMMIAMYIVCTYFARLTAHVSLQLVVHQTTPFLVSRQRMKEWEHIPVDSTVKTHRWNESPSNDIKCAFCKSSMQLSGADTIQCVRADCRLTVNASQGTTAWDVPKDLLINEPQHWQLWSRISISQTRLCHLYSSSSDSRSSIYHSLLDQIECSPYLQTRFDRRATQSFIISQPETENSFRAFIGSHGDQVRILLPQILDENGHLGGTSQRSSIFGAAVSAARHSDIQIIRIYHVVHGEHLDANNEARVERRWLDDNALFSYAHSLEDAVKSFAPGYRGRYQGSGPAEVWVMLSYLAVRRNKSRAGEVARDEEVFTAEMQVQMKPTNNKKGGKDDSSSSSHDTLAQARPSRPISQISQFDRVRLLPRQLLCLRLRPQPLQGSTPLSAVVISSTPPTSQPSSLGLTSSSSHLFGPQRTQLLMPSSSSAFVSNTTSVPIPTSGSTIQISMSPIGRSNSGHHHTTGGSSIGSTGDTTGSTSSMTTQTTGSSTRGTSPMNTGSSINGNLTSTGRAGPSPPKRVPIIPAHSHYVTLAT